MTHLPHHRADEVATKADVADLRRDFDIRFDGIEARFDRLEERLDRSQRFYVGITFGTLTAMTAIFSVVVSLLT